MTVTTLFGEILCAVPGVVVTMVGAGPDGVTPDAVPGDVGASFLFFPTSNNCSGTSLMLDSTFPPRYVGE